MWATLTQARARSRPRSSRCSMRASIRALELTQRRAQGAKPTIARRHRGRAGGGREPRRGPHPAPLRQRGAGGDPHQLSIRSTRDGRPKPLIAIKFASRKLDGVPLPRPLLRDLRLFAAGRGRAPALRQGGARRHPLVRPAAGFPHRDPRPGQGAAGQERRDRAGRRQGRLRAEVPAEGGTREAVAGRRRRRPTSCSSRRCSTSPTISATRA